jgi:hypothetical protein
MKRSGIGVGLSYVVGIEVGFTLVRSSPSIRSDAWRAVKLDFMHFSPILLGHGRAALSAFHFRQVSSNRDFERVVMKVVARAGNGRNRQSLAVEI